MPEEIDPAKLDTAWIPCPDPIKSALPAGGALLLLPIQGASETLKSICAATRGRRPK